jgi:NAD(P)-dependent dehydrogenase (short-subunit alcohol dehydrogenase family)
MSRELEGKVAIVTGSGNPLGIGAAYARGLAEAGAAVVVADIRADGARAVADALAADGLRAVGVGVDITSEDSTKAMAARAAEEFGGIDILVNNAAMMAEITQVPMMEFSVDEWHRVFDVNLMGAWLCARAVVPSMRERGGGRIVNQASVGAFVPVNTYGITKLGIVGLTIVLAKELGPSNITVNAIAPGAVSSEAGQRIAPPGSPFRKRLENAVALRDVGDPTELVGPLLLLVGPGGSWMTGQTITVDGGFVMRT